MTLRNYGLLTGKVIDHGPQFGGNPHYVLMVQAGVIPYQVAFNVESTRPQGDMPAALEYQIRDDLVGSKLTASIVNRNAFVLRDVDPSCPSLDFIRDGILDMDKFESLKPGLSQKRNPLYQRMTSAAVKAEADAGAFVAVFGTGFPDQDDRPAGRGRNPLRASSGFSGVDNVHMNQGSLFRVGHNVDPSSRENGTHQDGAVLFFFSDRTVVGFFVKFVSQNNHTDDLGNPVHTGIAQLDSLKAIPEKVRQQLLQRHAQGKKRGAATASRSAKSGRGRAHNPTSEPAQAMGTSTTEIPVAGTSGGQKAAGFTFADTTIVIDPNRPFDVDDDSAYRKSAFVDNFANGTPEPVPSSRNGVYPVMKLEDVIGTRAVAAIKANKQIRFHAVGDTGAPVKEKYSNEETVAQLMLQDFASNVPTVERPAFFFHLGDVVYYYGEQEYYYDQFYHPYKDYPAAILAIPGNHDGITHPDGAATLQGFISAFCDDTPRFWRQSGGIRRTTMNQPGVYFTLDAPFVSIIGLYSNCAERYGYLDEQQKLFLLSELKRLKSLRESNAINAVLLAVHHCPMSFSVSKPASASMRADIDSACKQANFWPDAVFSGHAHLYQRMARLLTIGGKPWQIPHFIAGSGGYANSGNQEVDKNDMKTQDISDPEFRLHNFMLGYGYLLVTVTPGKPATLRVEFHSPGINNGQPADTCVLNLDNHQII
jgi:uncharacterized protein YukJ